jgi:hypothetical protein
MHQARDSSSAGAAPPYKLSIYHQRDTKNKSRDKTTRRRPLARPFTRLRSCTLFLRLHLHNSALRWLLNRDSFYLCLVARNRGRARCEN